ncbi:S-adenosylmethionine uptake transporter [Sphingomonas sp. OV641]|uniref:DMT family transporter n=1 Tax=unclassified Sphingomonas TaxID=196159 RepID=UPI00082ED0CA|nr:MULTISPECIES: DMT family transporter [unclassified Sphingomonas]SEJ70134.1 S-adenosylmethionine uptake transporter [Sphingomonas sp. OV641]
MTNSSREMVPVGVAFLIGALGIGLFSVMDAVMKGLVLALGVYNTMLWRSLGNVALGGIAWATIGIRRPTRRALVLHLTRGAVTCAMALLFFWGLARVPMAQAIALSYIAPILALILAAWWLKERVSLRTVMAVLVASLGIMTIFIGQAQAALGPDAFDGAIAILASAVLYAVNLILTRLQSLAARPAETACLQSLVILCLLGMAAPWLAVIPPAATILPLGGAALLAFVSMMLLSWAYAHGEAGYLAMTEYTSFVYAAVLGFLVFGERVSGYTLIGAIVIVAACVYAARRRDIAAQTLEQAA